MVEIPRPRKDVVGADSELAEFIIVGKPVPKFAIAMEPCQKLHIMESCLGFAIGLNHCRLVIYIANFLKDSETSNYPASVMS
jgi:hypothetical protein